MMANPWGIDVEQPGEPQGRHGQGAATVFPRKSKHLLQSLAPRQRQADFGAKRVY